MSVKNYSYHAYEPTQGHETALDQLRLAHRYRNKLVELELARRAAVESALRERWPRLATLDAEIASADAEVEEIAARIKAGNSAARKRRTSPEDRDALAAAKAARRTLYAERKALRAAAFASDSLGEIEAAHKAAHKEARATCGVYWGTYLRVEEAAESMRKGAPPRFERFDGEGSLGVQIQLGMSWAELLAGNDTRARLIARSAREYDLWFRIGSQGREPVWCVLPVLLHRHAPDGARLKCLAVHRRIIGREGLTTDGRRWVHAGRVEWALTLTLDLPAEPATARGGIVGVDIGWRQMPDGALRVAVASGDHGEQELRLPAELCAMRDKSRSIRSFRDRDLTAALAGLLEWRRSLADVPEWFAERTKTLHLWRSPAALAALVQEWREHRIAGDDAPWPGADCWGSHEAARLGRWPGVFDALEAWRRRDNHLGRYEIGLLSRFDARRDEMYRVFAARLAEQYDSVALEKFDLRSMSTAPAPGEEDQSSSAMRDQKSLGNTSRLRSHLREKMTPIEVPAEHTTTTCHVCGQRCEWDAAAHLSHTCEHCGATWDQDANAARNIRARGAAVSTSRPPLADDSGA